MTNQVETKKPASRRGHNAMVTGLAMFVFGVIGAIMWGGVGLGAFCIIVAIAGFVTGIIGIGMRRER